MVGAVVAAAAVKCHNKHYFPRSYWETTKMEEVDLLYVQFLHPRHHLLLLLLSVDLDLFVADVVAGY